MSAITQRSHIAFDIPTSRLSPSADGGADLVFGPVLQLAGAVLNKAGQDSPGDHISTHIDVEKSTPASHADTDNRPRPGEI